MERVDSKKLWMLAFFAAYLLLALLVVKPSSGT
jgi:hypothetical protein